MFSKMKISVFVVLTILVSTSGHSQGLVTSFIAEAQTMDSASGVVLTGSFPGRKSLTESTISGQLGLDVDGQKASFPSFLMSIEPIQMSADLSTDSGESIPIEGTIAFDPIFFYDDTEYALTAGSSGQFHISESDWDRREPSTEENRLSGNYGFSSPNGSIGGTFSHTPSWQRSAENRVIIDTTDPDRVTIPGATNMYWEFDDDLELVAGTVEGIDLSVSVTGGKFLSPDDFQFNRIIPEPSTYAFVGGSFLIAFITFRRIKFARQTAS